MNLFLQKTKSPCVFHTVFGLAFRRGKRKCCESPPACTAISRCQQLLKCRVLEAPDKKLVPWPLRRPQGDSWVLHSGNIASCGTMNELSSIQLGIEQNQCPHPLWLLTTYLSLKTCIQSTTPGWHHWIALACGIEFTSKLSCFSKIFFFISVFHMFFTDKTRGQGFFCPLMKLHEERLFKSL